MTYAAHTDDARLEDFFHKKSLSLKCDFKIFLLNFSFSFLKRLRKSEAIFFSLDDLRLLRDFLL